MTRIKLNYWQQSIPLNWCKYEVRKLLARNRNIWTKVATHCEKFTNSVFIL